MTRFLSFLRADGAAPRALARLLAWLVFVAMSGGCKPAAPGGAGPMAGPGGRPGMNLPPAEVGVVTVAAENAVRAVELPGRVTPVRVAEVRARVTGILLKRLFEEGAEVKADQVLFEIDPAPLQAIHDSARAALARARAILERAQADARRKETLVKINGVSRQSFEEAQAAARQAEADVLAAQAALDKAALDLGYARVTAPISGRIGKALITEGALASAAEATRMAVIRQLDPIYVDFSQSSTEALKLRRAVESGKLQSLSNAVHITLLLEDGSAYARPGRLLFEDVSVDEGTGSFTLRGEFPNPDKVLLPGMFVRGRIEVAVELQAITVPQRGVTRDAYGEASVLLVNAQEQVELRPIQTGGVSGDRWIVTRGLQPGDRVIVEGVQKVRPGATVKAVPFAAKSATAAPAPAVAPSAASSSH